MARTKAQTLRRIDTIARKLQDLRAEGVLLIVEARDLGATHAEIAKAAGFTRQRISQILRELDAEIETVKRGRRRNE
jgi:hypothetical protein